MPQYRAGYTEAEKKMFGSAVRRLMNERGINQSELGRRASQYLPSKTPIPRAAVSTYVNGTAIPSEERLEALARVFNLPAASLLPRAHRQAPGEPPPADASDPKDVRMSLTPDGQMHLLLNVKLPRAAGQEILDMVLKLTKPGG